jgi:hypothetical protein
MTDETKNLFDAPWYVFSAPDDEITVIENESGRVLAELDDVKTTNRLARVPELYDALANAVRDACQDCVDQVYDHPTDYDPVKYGCLFKDKNCCTMCRSWIELLRKVRDGE